MQSGIDTHPFLRYALAIGGLLLVGTVLAGIAYRRELREPEHRGFGDRPRGAILDPWTEAQNAALAGNYLEAAHALYLAVLHTLAISDRLVIDSAKTVADYTRDLRGASSRSLPLYRDFARVYEPVVWGSLECDRAAFEQLSAIARRMSGRSA
jgi:hypothetical protein